MISFTLIKTIMILIALIIITNNKKLSKLFNFKDISNENLKYKLLFYINIIILIKIKKILYLILIIYFIFNIYHIIKIYTTYETSKLDPIIKNKNNLLYILSIISFLNINNLYRLNNKKFFIKIFIKIIPNILLSISILIFNINLFITNIIYNNNFFKIKFEIFNIVYSYTKIYNRKNFYGMKKIDEKILKQINSLNDLKTNNSCDFKWLQSKTKLGEDIYHPTMIWNDEKIIITNTITHNPINYKLDALKIGEKSYSELVIANKSNIKKMSNNYYKKILEELKLYNQKNFDKYKESLEKYNSYVLTSNKEILNQTSDKKFMNVNEALEITNNKPLEVCTTIDVNIREEYECIIEQDSELYGFYLSLPEKNKVSFLIKLAEIALNHNIII